jgi:hypothetical protein
MVQDFTLAQHLTPCPAFSIPSTSLLSSERKNTEQNQAFLSQHTYQSPANNFNPRRHPHSSTLSIRTDMQKIIPIKTAYRKNSVEKFISVQRGQTARVLNMIHRNREEEDDEDAGAKNAPEKEEECYRTLR